MVTTLNNEAGMEGYGPFQSLSCGSGNLFAIVTAKLCTLPECSGKISFVASGRFMMLERFFGKYVCPRIGSEVTVGCPGPTPTNYKLLWTLPEPFLSNTKKTTYNYE